MKYSIIVPVYNRPDEVDELLQSLTTQSYKDFEVVIVEDGSTNKCKDVCNKYADVLALRYYDKPNSGPGQSRNYGAERANGEWFIILDSDVVLPEGYLESVERALTREREESRPIMAWGGPDASHSSFTPVQKAISYSMTSFFTTGGIRGARSKVTSAKRLSTNGAQEGARGKKALDKFFPRSFNMGIKREVYIELGGFSKMRFGEDIDFSYRIVEAGYKTALIPDAWVWHKRRTDFRKFWRQVYNSGIARINLEKRHPGTLKLVHLLPTVFTVGIFGLLLLFLIGLLTGLCWLTCLSATPILLYCLLICTDSAIVNKSVKVGLLSVPAAFVQLMGYGCGFMESWWKRCVLKKDEFQAYEKNFYK